MKTVIRYAFPAFLLFLPLAVAHAQSGCANSPECPTAVLGAVGAAGAALYARWRMK